MQCAIYTVQCAVCSVQYIMCSVQYAVCIVPGTFVNISVCVLPDDHPEGEEQHGQDDGEEAQAPAQLAQCQGPSVWGLDG